MNEENKTNTPQNDIFNGVLMAQTALNKGGVMLKQPIEIKTGKANEININTMLDEMFKNLPEGTRFAGQTQTISLPADISEEFDVKVSENVTGSFKLSENVTIADKEKQELRQTPIKSLNASFKIPVIATYNEQTYNGNINITKENLSEVKALLINGTAKATTSHWGDGDKILTKNDGSRVAKLVLSSVNTEQKPEVATKTESSIVE